MKNEIILVTGGARSGKSRFAESLLKPVGAKYYLATCPVPDAEMAERVKRHQAARAAQRWITIEEPLDLFSAVRRARDAGAEGLLIDCLTLWINNLLYEAEQQKQDLTEEKMERSTRAVLTELAAFPGRAVLVISEVGLGIVPESPLARRFRDLSGRCAQCVAAQASQVYFCVAGIAQRIK